MTELHLNIIIDSRLRGNDILRFALCSMPYASYGVYQIPIKRRPPVDLSGSNHP